MDIKQLDSNLSVGEQITPNELKKLKDLGYSVIINNRPDGEEDDQPKCADLKQAAKDLGLTYHHLPLVSGAGISKELVESMKNAIKDDKKTFCFCRSGTRSTMLWALSQRGKKSADEIINSAKNAGYDISHLKEAL
ncbi:MAG: TIGR01244 family sulfur transferase [Helicobacter sp.]|nr:TIGR01244 family sulfur transferase [Helicobacter sp.]